MEPMEVGDFGRMLMAQDPGGAVFGIWQEKTHHGFEKRGEPGSFIWTELLTREPGVVDAFYPAIFPFEVKTMEEPSMDYKTWDVGGETVAGRMKMTEDFPAEVPPHFQVYFAVENCDDAVATVNKLGGQLHYGPEDSPFGRFAAVADQQGAAFCVIDCSTTVGEMPPIR
jgi:uncharacterized protein